MKIFNRISINILLLMITIDGFSQFSKINEEIGIFNINEDTDYGNGVSFYDINKDGWDDLSIGNGSDEPIFLLNNYGTYIDANFNLEINPIGQVIMILWSDYDNDGDSDLLITQLYGPLQLWNNDGLYNFSNVATEAGLNEGNYRFRGAAFADYDHDGFLDLYVAKYYALLNDSDINKQGILYHNNGDGTFTDVTNSSGVMLLTCPIFQPVFFDYNKDGWEDLYLVIDRNLWRNELFKNNGDGTFTNVSDITGGTPAIDAMSFTVDDFDNDSDFDFYVSNGLPGNHLYRCNSDTTFENIATGAGVTVNLICWGALWLDYDNNSWQDLFVGTSGNFFGAAQNKFFINNEDGTFSDGTEITGITGDLAPSFVSAMGDMNNDGYYDYVTNNNEPFITDFWRNNGGTNNYLSISLEGIIANRDGIGSEIHCYAGNEHFVRYTHAGENFQGQNSSKEIFGLGENENIDSLIVKWNSGTIDRFFDFQSNRYVHIIEGCSSDTIVEITYSDDLILCQGESLILTATFFDNLLWNDGSQNSTLIATTPGEYSVEATNRFGQIFQDVITVEADPYAPPQIITSNASCANSEDGSILIEPNNYIQSIILDGIESNEWSFDELSAGTYQIQIMSNAGCSYLHEIVISQPDPIEINLIINNQTDSEMGSAIAEVIGGTLPYQYSWNSQNELNAPINENLVAGTHLFSITDSSNCSVEISFEVDFIASLPYLFSKNFFLFPNPANDYISTNINFEKSIWTNVSGQQILIPVVEGIIKTTDLSSGIYQVQLLDFENKMSHTRILIID